jgi:hypothetical protein
VKPPEDRNDAARKQQDDLQADAASQYRIGSSSLAKVHFDGDVNNQSKISVRAR